MLARSLRALARSAAPLLLGLSVASLVASARVQDAPPQLEGKLVLPEGVTGAIEVLVLDRLSVESSGDWYDAVEDRADDVRQHRIEAGAFALPVDELPATLWIEGGPCYLSQPVVFDGSRRVRLRPAVAATLTLRSSLSDGADPAIFAGTQVDLVGSPKPQIGAMPQSYFHRGKVRLRATFDATGVARFDGLNPDRCWRTSVDVPGYRLVAVEECDLVARGEIDVPIPLDAGATVRGVVRGPSGQPIEGLRVRWSPIPPKWGLAVKRATTDADGRFQITGATPGEGQLHVDGAWFRPRIVDDLTLVMDRPVDGVVVVMDPRPPVRLRLTDEDGSHLAGARVVLEERRDRPSGPLLDMQSPPAQWVLETDAEGCIDLPCQDVESYVLSASWISPEGTASMVEQVEIDASDERQVVSLEVRHGLHLRFVRPDGGPLRDATVSVFTIMHDRRVGTSSSPDDLGVFRFPDLESGEYSIWLRSRDWVPVLLHPVLPDFFDDELGVSIGIRSTGYGVHAVDLLPAARIEGRVVDEGDRGVPAARVDLFRHVDPEFRGEAFDPELPALSVEADRNGVFVFDGLPAGAYALVAAHAGYAPSARVELALAVGESRDDAEVRLQDGGTLYCTIRGPDGAVHWSTVNVFDAETGQLRRRRITRVEEGDRVGSFAPGTYRVELDPRDELAGARRAAWSGAERSVDDVVTVELAAGEERLVEFGEPPARHRVVRGRVTSGGAPMRGGSVRVYESDASLAALLGFATVGADGRFELEVTARRSVVVACSPLADGSGAVRRPARLPRDDAEWIVDLPSAAIDGRVVTEDGAPADGARVLLFRRDGSLPGAEASASCDADGRYGFAHLDPGAYAVRAVSKNDARFTAGASEAVDVVVSEATVAAPVLTFRRSAAVTGVVVDADGAPVRYAEVWLRDGDGRPASSLPVAIADVDGRFTAYASRETGLYVEARAGSSASAPTFIAPDADGDVTLVAREGTTLHVRVMDGAGLPRRVVPVVRREDGLVFSAWRARSPAPAHAASEAGRFEFGPLPPGRYVAEATDEDGATDDRRARLSGRPRRTVTLRLER